MRRTINLRDFERRLAPHQLSALSVTTYDFRTAMKRVGASIRRSASRKACLSYRAASGFSSLGKRG